MRRLVWFTVGFTAAVAACAYFLSMTAALVLLVLLGVLYLFRKKPVLLVLCLGLAAGMLSFLCYDGLVLSKARLYDGVTTDLTVTASDYTFHNGYTHVTDGTVTLQGRRFAVRVYCKQPILAEPGDRLTGSMQLFYTPGGEKATTYHKGEGILLLAYANELQYEKMTGKVNIAAALRRSSSQRITELFPADTAAFAKAFLLGMDDELRFQDNMAFQRSGVRHVIAVSGLHVSILFAALYLLTGRKRLLLLLLGFPLLLLFAAVAGFTPSVVRACIMQGLIILSLALDREYDLPTALAFSVLVMLVVNPYAVTSVSLQLSVCSMIGILLCSRPIARYLMDPRRLGPGRGKTLGARLTRWFTRSVSVSFGALIATMPLCAIYFDTVSLLGLLGNLLILWILSFLFYGIMAACLVSVVWYSMGQAVAWLISYGIRYVLWMTGLVAKIPVGVLYVDSPYTVLWIILTYVIIGLGLLLKTKKPLRCVVASGLLLVLCITAGWLEPRLDNVRLTMLDVGQGQCILLQCREKSYLIDCGGSDPQETAAAARNAMGAQGISRLDGLILTHYDTDHVNGAQYLLQIMDVEKLYLPDTPDTSGTRLALEQSGIPVELVVREQILPCHNGQLCLYPSTGKTEGNESSMCILFQGETCGILITGDRNLAGEDALIAQTALPDVDILVAGHHGSAESTGSRLLQTITPEVVLISVGEDNLHGHPDTQTIRRLTQLGCIIRRTDQEGTIIIRG